MTTETEEVTFAEQVRRIVGRALVDLQLGQRELAVNALGDLLTTAERIVHGTAMAAEVADPKRYALTELVALVNLRSQAPERED